MSSNGHMTAAEIRARLHHPIIDADGHWLEYGPLVNEELFRTANYTNLQHPFINQPAGRATRLGRENRLLWSEPQPTHLGTFSAQARAFRADYPGPPG